MTEIVHMSCLGILCESIDKHYSVSKITKEEYNKVTTFNINKVTCSKCIEILKKENILR